MISEDTIIARYLAPIAGKDALVVCTPIGI